MASLGGKPSRRLLKEYSDARKASEARQSGGAAARDGRPEESIELLPLDEYNLTEWEAVITPPDSSLYHGGTFAVSIVCPPRYPIEPPKCTFKTAVCHPNIHPKTGEICLDVLKAQWSPAWTLQSTCLAILVLLDSPDESSPLFWDDMHIGQTWYEHFKQNKRVEVQAYSPSYSLHHGGSNRQWYTRITFHFWGVEASAFT